MADMLTPSHAKRARTSRNVGSVSNLGLSSAPKTDNQRRAILFENVLCQSDLTSNINSFLSTTEYFQSMASINQYYHRFTINENHRKLFLKMIRNDWGTDVITKISDQLSALSTPKMIASLYAKLNPFVTGDTPMYSFRCDCEPYNDDSEWQKCMKSFFKLVKLVQTSDDYNPKFVWQRFQQLSAAKLKRASPEADTMVVRWKMSPKGVTVDMSPKGITVDIPIDNKRRYTEIRRYVFSGMILGDWRHSYDSQLSFNAINMHQFKPVLKEIISADYWLCRNMLRPIIKILKKDLQFYVDFCLLIWNCEWDLNEYPKLIVAFFGDLFVYYSQTQLPSILKSEPIKLLISEIKKHPSANVEQIKSVIGVWELYSFYPSLIQCMEETFG